MVNKPLLSEDGVISDNLMISIEYLDDYIVGSVSVAGGNCIISPLWMLYSSSSLKPEAAWMNWCRIVTFIGRFILGFHFCLWMKSSDPLHSRPLSFVHSDCCQHPVTAACLLQPHVARTDTKPGPHTLYRWLQHPVVNLFCITIYPPQRRFALKYLPTALREHHRGNDPGQWRWWGSAAVGKDPMKYSSCAN